jgi:hypothetical protein
VIGSPCNVPEPEPRPKSRLSSARAAEERRLAEIAADPNARAAHERLAEQYERLAKGGAEQVAEIRQQAG